MGTKRKALRRPVALAALVSAILSAPLLSGCSHANAGDEGPKPGEMRTTDGKPAPPEAASVQGDAPPSNMPPPGQGGPKGRRRP